MDLISDGFKAFNPSESYTTPSTNINGSLSPKVESPLIRIFADPPGEPEFVEIVTPETCPCKAWSIRETFNFSMSSPFTFPAAPVTSLLVTSP